MALTLAVDPGKWHAGFALFDDKRLVYCGEPRFPKLKKSPLIAVRAVATEVASTARRFGPVTHAVFERPSVWTRGGSRGNPNDILDLMATNGAIALAVAPLRAEYLPVVDWKGQATKEVIEKRVRKRLTEEEMLVFGDNPSHNTVDAVGIGMVATLRMVKR